VAANEQTSIWKKEIHLRRRRRRAAPPASPAPQLEPDAVATMLRPVERAPVEAPPEAEQEAAMPPVSLPAEASRPKGLRVPPAPSRPERPESVAALLHPAGEELQAAAPEPALEPAPKLAREPAQFEDVYERLALPEELAALAAPPGPARRNGKDRRERLPRAERKRLAKAAKEARHAAREAEKQAARQAKAAAAEARRAGEAERAQQAEKREQAERRRHERERGKDAQGRSTRPLKRVVGLKIGTSQLSAAVVENDGDRRVAKLARVPLEQGVVAGGEVRDPERLTAALRAFFREHGLPRRDVRLGVSSNRIGLRIIEIAAIDDPKQLANAIRFRAQETVPVPLDEAVLDYRVLDQREHEDGSRTLRVLVVVAHRALIDGYAAACKRAGLKLAGVDLEAFALLRAMAPPEERGRGGDSAFVVVGVGSERSTIAVSSGEICEFMRVVEWGGSSLDTAIANALEISPREAEQLKLGLELDAVGEAPGLDAEQAERARDAMRMEVQSFVRDLVASLRLYQEQPGSLGIAELVLTGGGAECGGLPAEIERLVGVAVRRGDVLARVRPPKKERDRRVAELPSLAVAVGLGIEE